MNIHLDLMLTFAKIGATTFGGGMAMLPLISAEVVEKKKWATDEEIADCFAISQCTPGVIAVNTATFVGYKTAGILGGITATIGMVLPSIIIILLLAALIQNFAHIDEVQYALSGLRAGLCALILHAVIKMLKTVIKNKVGAIIFAAAFILAAFTNISIVILVIIAGAVGCAVSYASRQRGGEGK